MSRPSFGVRVLLCALLAFTLPPAIAPSLAQQQVQPGEPEPVPECPEPPDEAVDNRDGHFVNLEEPPVHPLELGFGGDELWAVNLADASVSVFDASTPSTLGRQTVVKVGLGPVSIRRRPGDGQSEMWVVCQSSNSLFIIDEASQLVVESIRLEHEPTDLVFSEDGGRAFVTLSASNQVLEVDAVTRTPVTPAIELGTDFPPGASDLVHVEEPRTLIRDGNSLFALSLKSGNGTMGLTVSLVDPGIFNLWDFYDPLNNIPPPPDRDVLRIDPLSPTFCGPLANQPCGDTAMWRAGSMNFDLLLDDDGELWVSNIDYNNTLVGEFQFPTAGIAQHRLTHAPPLAPGSPAPTTPPASIDLNDDVAASLLQDGFACGMPNEMELWVLPESEVRQIYVACYETHNVAVVDLDLGRVTAELTAHPAGGGAPAWRNSGVHGIVLNRSAGVAYAWSRDHRVQVYAVPVLLGSSGPVQEVGIGFDITSDVVLEGRFHSINGKRSAVSVPPRPQSCNTCHIHGHFDGLAWNLSDFTGDLPSDPVGRTPKGAKTTLSLRGIEETPPFHWTGDRADLSAFDTAFVGLLGGPALSTAELDAFYRYVFTLSYPANPHQPLERLYSAPALTGFGCFFKEAHDVSFSVGGPATPISCEGCHGMAGFSATNNQVNNDVVGLLAEDATQLRGLFDKEADIVDYSSFPVMTVPLNMLPATGWGFANTGFVDTVTDFVNLGVFNLVTQVERDRIIDFLGEFDTGIAPAAAFAWTLNQASAGSASQPFNTLLEAQALGGHIDLIVRGAMQLGGSGPLRPVGMLYNTRSRQFDTNRSGLGPFAYSTLVSRAAAGNGIFTLIGVPVGTGYRLALDEEMDYLVDGDEAVNNAVVGDADSDNDNYPDGYEVRFMSDPGLASSTPPAETVPPVILSPRVAWVNSNVAKVRWSTDEESTSRIEAYLAGTSTQVAVAEERTFKKQHVLVVRGLTPGTTYDFQLMSEDPANGAAPGNVGTRTLTNVAMQALQFQSVHVDQTTLTVVSTGGAGQPVTLRADFSLVDETGAAIADGATVSFDRVEWIPGGGTTTNPPTSHTTNPSVGGVASLTFTSVNGMGSGGEVEVFATAVTEPTTNRLYFHPLDGQFGHWDSLPLP